jgi:hypothetical protein
MICFPSHTAVTLWFGWVLLWSGMGMCGPGAQQVASAIHTGLLRCC